MQTCSIHDTRGELIRTVSKTEMLKLPSGKYPITNGTITCNRAVYYLNEGTGPRFVFAIATSKIASTADVTKISSALFAKYTDAIKTNDMTLVVENG